MPVSGSQPHGHEHISTKGNASSSPTYNTKPTTGTNNMSSSINNAIITSNSHHHHSVTSNHGYEMVIPKTEYIESAKIAPYHDPSLKSSFLESGKSDYDHHHKSHYADVMKYGMDPTAQAHMMASKGYNIDPMNLTYLEAAKPSMYYDPSLCGDVYGHGYLDHANKLDYGMTAAKGDYTNDGMMRSGKHPVYVMENNNIKMEHYAQQAGHRNSNEYGRMDDGEKGSYLDDKATESSVYDIRQQHGSKNGYISSMLPQLKGDYSKRDGSMSNAASTDNMMTIDGRPNGTPPSSHDLDTNTMASMSHQMMATSVSQIMTSSHPALTSHQNHLQLHPHQQQQQQQQPSSYMLPNTTTNTSSPKRVEEGYHGRLSQTMVSVDGGNNVTQRPTQSSSSSLRHDNSSTLHTVPVAS